jgi:DNA-binding GntR family transcriptional regulator
MTDMVELAGQEAEPIERGTLSEVVKDRILTWILEGELAPGSRIVETRVARDLGTSQAPVREALRDLAVMGFVDMRPHRGARVRKPTKQELTEAIEVRAELEALAGRLAAERRTDSCLKQLEGHYAAMQEAADRGDAHDHAVSNTRFHATIFEAARNGTLARLWSMLEPFSRTYVTATVPGIDLHWLAARHQRMLAAIRDQDAEAAAEEMRRHAAEAADLLVGLEVIDEEADEAD